jgi:hypothetical protein
LFFQELFVFFKNYFFFLRIISFLKEFKEQLYNNTTTLKNLNFDVYVGTVVWNQNKDLLTDDTTFTRLIYSSDIVDNTLVKQTYKNAEKKNHIKKDGRTGMILVINRGYGVGKYKFNFCLIDNKEKYLQPFILKWDTQFLTS